MLASSALSLLWFLCGLVAVITMLKLLGGKPDASSRSTLKWTHRIFGGIFSTGYIVFLLLMIPKYHGNSPLLSWPIAVHAYVALGLLPILFIKHYILRVAKKYYQALPYIGIAIFLMAFLVIAPTGLSHVTLWTKTPKMTVQSPEGSRIVSTAVGRELVPIKCSRCHNLSPLYKARKGEEQWRKTIGRMNGYDKALIITQDHIDHIVGYLLLER